MPQDRFYLDAPLQTGQTVALKDTEFHHLKVLRIAPSEEIELVNGQGFLAKANLVKLDKRSAQLRISSCIHSPPPSPSISLALALIRLSRLEWAIEKATELGADDIFLYPADQSEKKNLSLHQLERLGHLAISAFKQCGRLYLPRLSLSSLEKILLTSNRILYGDTNPNAPRLNSSSRESILFISGPEKGFSEQEKILLQAKGMGVKLNENILRAETAPLTALSILK